MSRGGHTALADSHWFGVILDLVFSLQGLFFIEREVCKSRRPRGGAKQSFLQVCEVLLCRIRRGSSLCKWIRRGPVGFSDGSDSKESACSAGDAGSIPGSGRSPGEGNGNPLQYSCWRIPRTVEPGGLASMGSQRVGHDWVTNTRGGVDPPICPSVISTGFLAARASCAWSSVWLPTWVGQQQISRAARNRVERWGWSDSFNRLFSIQSAVLWSLPIQKTLPHEYEWEADYTSQL